MVWEGQVRQVSSGEVSKGAARFSPAGSLGLGRLGSVGVWQGRSGMRRSVLLCTDVVWSGMAGMVRRAEVWLAMGRCGVVGQVGSGMVG